MAGGGIYSTSADYVKVLQHLLQHRLSLSGRASRPKTTLLSDTSLNSLFSGTLPEAGLPAITKMFEFQLGPETFAPGEADWSTGMSVYAPKDGRRRGGYGRLAGSVGWGGAAGTQYWIDEKSGIAVSSVTPSTCDVDGSGTPRDTMADGRLCSQHRFSRAPGRPPRRSRMRWSGRSTRRSSDALWMMRAAV